MRRRQLSLALTLLMLSSLAVIAACTNNGGQGQRVLLGSFEVTYDPATKDVTYIRQERSLSGLRAGNAIPSLAQDPKMQGHWPGAPGPKTTLQSDELHCSL